MLDGDDVRCAQDAQHQRSAIGMVKPTSRQGNRGRRVEGQPKFGTANVDGGNHQAMKGHRG